VLGGATLGGGGALASGAGAQRDLARPLPPFARHLEPAHAGDRGRACELAAGGQVGERAAPDDEVEAIRIDADIVVIRAQLRQ